jgi:hypothetical protein
LIVGPLIAALGFVLFVLRSTEGSYWASFFPAIIVLGFGMAVTVAPLTTVVMNSVDQDRVGAASGINNAVARVAGVLAIAVLGLVIVHAFSSRLNRTLAHMALPSSVVHENQTRGLTGARQSGSRYEVSHRGTDSASIRIWVPHCHADLRQPVSGERHCRVAHDSW